jgi:hypothetical protein
MTDLTASMASGHPWRSWHRSGSSTHRPWLQSRSAAAAIAGGLGYMLLGENLLASLWSNAGDWLPSGTVDTLLAGGTPDIPYSRALTLALTYIAAAVAASLVVIAKRDVTD